MKSLFANFPSFLLFTNVNCLPLHCWPSTNKSTGILAKKDFNQIQTLYILVSEMYLSIFKFLPITRFYPAADLPGEIETPDERVMFIRSVVQFMATKSHVKVIKTNSRLDKLLLNSKFFKNSSSIRVLSAILND